MERGCRNIFSILTAIMVGLLVFYAFLSESTKDYRRVGRRGNYVMQRDCEASTAESLANNMTLRLRLPHKHVTLMNHLIALHQQLMLAAVWGVGQVSLPTASPLVLSESVVAKALKDTQMGPTLVADAGADDLAVTTVDIGKPNTWQQVQSIRVGGRILADSGGAITLAVSPTPRLPIPTRAECAELRHCSNGIRVIFSMLHGAGAYTEAQLTTVDQPSKVFEPQSFTVFVAPCALAADVNIAEIGPTIDEMVKEGLLKSRPSTLLVAALADGQSVRTFKQTPWAQTLLLNRDGDSMNALRAWVRAETAIVGVPPQNRPGGYRKDAVAAVNFLNVFRRLESRHEVIRFETSGTLCKT